MAVLSLYIINIPKIYNKCRSKVRIHILIRCNWDVIERHAGIVPECLPSTCLALLASAFFIFCFLFFLIVLHGPSCAGHMINNLLYYICITYDLTISWGFIASSIKRTLSVLKSALHRKIEVHELQIMYPCQTQQIETLGK